MKTWITMSILGTLLFSGCGQPREEDEDQETIQQLKYAEDILGTWRGECIPNPDPYLIEAKSVRIYYNFSESRFFERHDAYTSNDCSGIPIYLYRKSGSYAVLEPQNDESPEAARKVDLNSFTVSIRPLTAQFVDFLNLYKTCEITDWALNIERAVSGMVCWGINAYPRAPLHTVFALLDDHEKLCLGKTDEGSLDGSKPSLRPNSLGPCYEKIP